MSQNDIGVELVSAIQDLCKEIKDLRTSLEEWLESIDMAIGHL